MAKDNAVVKVSSSDFTLMQDNAEMIDLSVELQKLGWTAPKVKTRDLVGQIIIIKDYKRVVDEDNPEKWYYYCACMTEDGQNDYCTILGGSQIKDYLSRAWDYNPRAVIRFRLGLHMHKTDRCVYFIDAP